MNNDRISRPEIDTDAYDDCIDSVTIKRPSQKEFAPPARVDKIYEMVRIGVVEFIQILLSLRLRGVAILKKGMPEIGKDFAGEQRLTKGMNCSLRHGGSLR